MAKNIDLIADSQPVVDAGETVNAFVDFFGKLDSGELLNGTPTVLEVDSSGDVITGTSGDLTISSITRNASIKTILGRSVAVDEGVEYAVSGFVAANTPYYLRVLCGTDAGQTRITYIKMPVVTPPSTGTDQ